MLPRVEKSFDLKPTALGVTMGEAGNQYGENPAAERVEGTSVPGKRGKLPVKLGACKEWLTSQLGSQPVRVKEVRTVALAAGYSTSTLYKAGKELGVVEDVRDGRKWLRLPEISHGRVP